VTNKLPTFLLRQRCQNETSAARTENWRKSVVESLIHRYGNLLRNIAKVIRT